MGTIPRLLEVFLVREDGPDQSTRVEDQGIYNSKNLSNEQRTDLRKRGFKEGGVDFYDAGEDSRQATFFYDEKHWNLKKQENCEYLEPVSPGSKKWMKDNPKLVPNMKMRNAGEPGDFKKKFGG